MKALLLTAFLFVGSQLPAQIIHTDTLFTTHPDQRISTRLLFNDSLASTFAICIKDEVKAHKHMSHTEHVLIVEGEGEMQLGSKKFMVKKDDLIFIPIGEIHSLKVTRSPVKVISIQTPYFDGKDRVFIE